MKFEMQSVLRKLDSDLTGAALQVRRVTPAMQLFSSRNNRKLRLAVPARVGRGLTLADRQLLAARRAAELVAWEATGGDVLNSPKQN